MKLDPGAIANFIAPEVACSAAALGNSTTWTWDRTAPVAVMGVVATPDVAVVRSNSGERRV